MRAVVVHDFASVADVRVENFPNPVAGPGEVLIEVAAIGLNFSDRLMIEGRYQLRPERPFVPGRDACGTVAAIGAGVTRCKPGDKVMAVVPFGAYAEQAVVPETRCWILPEAMEFTTGAALGNAHITAYLAASESGRLAPNESVLITGASGGVGLAAVEIARGLGAGAVIAGVTSADKGELALAHGAHHWVDLAADDLAKSLRAQVQEATDGRGVDLVLDNVGGDAFDAALRCLAPKGRMVVIGFASGRIPEAKTNYLLLKNLSIVGCHSEPYYADTELLDRIVADIFALHDQGTVRPNIMATYPLEDFQEALALFGNGRIRGKVVLTTGKQ